MALSAQIQTTQRGGANDGQPIANRGNQNGEQLIAQGFPPYVEMTRRFGYWSKMNTSALAALVVRPTTVANFTLFNPAASGYTLVMDRIFAFNLVSTAAAAKFGLWYCVHRPGLASPTNDITVAGSGVGAVATADPGGTYGDTAMTVIDDGWYPIGPWGDVEPTGVLPGGISEARFEGRVLIPPGCGISSQVVSAVTGNTFTTGFAWWPVPTSLITVE